jgi:hypothetical protein
MLKSDAPRLVPIAEIIRDARWYPRKRVPPEGARRCAELYRMGGPDALPPIMIGKLPHGPELLLVHGWQRVAGAEMAGLEALPAVTFGFLDGWEILATALRGGSAVEGPECRPISAAERRRVVDAFLKQFPGGEPLKMARRLGVTDEYLWRRRVAITRNPAAADPLGPRTRLLVKTAHELYGAEGGPSPLQDGERWDVLVTSLAEAARKRHSGEAELWLERLEGLVHAARRRLAAQTAPAPGE